MTVAEQACLNLTLSIDHQLSRDKVHSFQSEFPPIFILGVQLSCCASFHIESQSTNTRCLFVGVHMLPYYGHCHMDIVARKDYFVEYY